MKLFAIETKARNACLTTHVITDAGVTGISRSTNENMSIAIGPESIR